MDRASELYFTQQQCDTTRLIGQIIVFKKYISSSNCTLSNITITAPEQIKNF